jgi:hypothetical protein
MMKQGADSPLGIVSAFRVCEGDHDACVRLSLASGAVTRAGELVSRGERSSCRLGQWRQLQHVAIDAIAKHVFS